MPSIVSRKSGARLVVATDYPAPGILTAIQRNVQGNLSADELDSTRVFGLDWTDAEESLKDIAKLAPDGFTRWVQEISSLCITAVFYPGFGGGETRCGCHPTITWH